MLNQVHTVVLVLSGGNALGAYQAGGYAALHERGIRPDWVVGASTGAVNGAIICGNAKADRVARLADYWRPGPAGSAAAGWHGAEDARRSAAVTTALLTGQRDVFAPRPASLPWLAALGWGAEPSLYDTRPLGAALARLVDFGRLNGGETRFTAVAVDLESGEPVAFDTAKDRIDAEHIRASSALLPIFPPVEIDGRLLGDGGLAANLPVDVVLGGPPAGTTLCIALDLLPLAARRPRTLGEAASRMQDLMFASQSRLALSHWQARYAERAAVGTEPGSITVLHLAYDRQEAEVAGKAFDFSPASVRARWDAGFADVSAALDRIADRSIGLGAPGLTIWRSPGQALASDAAPR